MDDIFEFDRVLGLDECSKVKNTKLPQEFTEEMFIPQLFKEKDIDEKDE